MAEVLVLVKPAEGKVGKSTLEALTIARGLGEPAAVVVGAPGLAASLQDRLAEFGAAKIYAAESDELGDYLVTPKVAVLEQLARSVSPAAIVIPSTQEGKEVAGRLAVRLDNGVLTDVVGLDADGTATQVAFAGGTIVKSKVSRGIPLVTVRPAQPPQPTGDTPFAAQEAALGAVVYQVPPVHVSGPVKRNAELTVTTTCRPGSGVYWYSPRLNGPLTQNGARSQSVKNGVRGQAGMVPVGTVPASGKVDVSFTPTASGPLPQFPIGCLDQKALTAAVDHLKATGATDVKAGGHSIEATLPAGSTGVAVIAAPALKGWQCGPRDGALTTPQTWSGLLAVPLTPGTTAVRCVFTPPGFRPGLAAAGLALLAILAVQGFTFWRRRTS